jgi:2'-5' RNA ligase
VSPPAHRLFVAAWPPGAVIARLCSLTGLEQVGVRRIAPENWHVTLRFLGDADPAAVIDRLDAMTMPAATAVLGPAVRRLGRGMLVVPVRGVDELAATVRTATADVGEAPDPRPFTGHVTLARLRAGARSAAAGRPFTAEFHVDEVVLVNSVLGRSGAVYDVICRWPTAPNPEL